MGISGAPIPLMPWNALPVYAAFALTVIVFLLVRFVFEPNFKRYYERAHPGKPYPKISETMNALAMEPRLEGKLTPRNKKFFAAMQC